MNDIVYYVICAILAILVLVGIYLMSNVKLARTGNGISAFAMLGGIIVVLIKNEVFRPNNPLSICILILGIAMGTVVGLIFNAKVKMIQMPQMVALLNGLGGAASAIVGAMALLYCGSEVGKVFVAGDDPFSIITSALAVAVGVITLVGSLIAAGKLHRILPQKPIVVKGHQIFTTMSLAFAVISIILSALLYGIGIMPLKYMWILLLLNVVFSIAFGIFFSIRVGGADMPITISLLNSLSGVAGAIAGLAINDLLLVAVGGIVGASGLLLTQIMCKAINRSLLDILLGKTAGGGAKTVVSASKQEVKQPETELKKETTNPAYALNSAKNVIIVPGYGMAIAQAQHLVKKLADKLTANGALVKYAIHPVAGRMPGHMNVLLCEADVDYENLYEMKDIDGEFATADATIVVGANDVTNPSAKSAVGTPIYGMPVLSVNDCKNVYIFNYDTKPGYAGVENPLYTRSNGVYKYLGNASVTLQQFILDMDKLPQAEIKEEASPKDQLEPLRNAKNVIIVPGYGMAIAQAQHLVKKLADKLTGNGVKVKYAIHPVAGRMPGHMNVLLCEADVDYEDLYEMKDIDNEFATADATIVVGANDVTNPAARDAVGTPIYGMPVLSVDKCKNIYIFNYDTKPGYAGVQNPLYSRKEGTYLYLGNASVTLQQVLTDLDKAPQAKTEKVAVDEMAPIKSAKNVIIVPGYGMAIAQAQHLVKKLADKLTANGVKVKYAIHPVAGRMPGHMNVLLCEADVDYEDLYEMKDIDNEFAKADAAIIVGANDVTNPSARSAVGTPIYGMPVLSVDKCKNIYIFNYDTKPGYAGVENPLYSRKEGVYLHLGNAATTLGEFISKI